MKKPDPKDANIYTADKGQPPSPPDMMTAPKPKMKPKKAYAKGGAVRGAGCATKGVRKARMY